MLLIPGAMLVLSGFALAVVYFALNWTQWFFNCLYRSSNAADEEKKGEEAECEEPNAVYAESVSWIRRGYRHFLASSTSSLYYPAMEAMRSLKLARTAIPHFAYFALLAMAIAPGMLFSTWWAWQAYDGRHSTKEMGAMLFEVYEFSFESWTRNVEMPSILSLWELTDLTAEGFLSMLEELDAFKFIPPEVLLKRSRLLSLLSAPLAIAKGLLTVLQKILALCLSEGKGIQTVPVSAGASLAELHEMGYDAEEMIREKREMGYGDSATELKAAGFSATELKAAGFSAAALKDAGFSATELKAAGFSAAALKDVGLDVENELQVVV